ncbi:FAD-dependent monooxygenase [Streptomyces sp. Tue6028]|uniref:FAD-dependent monooxygenase n=1 Tax=Streptomyces sp. Tue6028 TaxID=2036037 RepID=UPI003D715D62
MAVAARTAGERERTEVIVVGAGPSGLTAATRLAQLGVPHVLIDAGEALTQTSNAALVHASTIEIMDVLGIGQMIIGAGHKIHRMVMSDRSGSLARIDLSGVPSPFPFALGIPQSSTEALLLGHLSSLGGSVRRGHSVDSVESSSGGYVVSGRVDSDTGERRFELQAPYVLGCDGSHSTVRSELNVGFPGETYPEQFVLADVQLESPPSNAGEAAIRVSPYGVTVIGRIAQDRYRVVATVDADATVPDTPDKAYVEALFRERDISARLVAEPEWSSRFRVHHRLADNFRSGGVFLVGDAAHVHSPAAGQGLNTGIADAYDITTRLAAVLTEQADESILDGYEQARRAAAQEVVRFTHRMTSMATLQHPIARFVRRVALGVLTRVPAVHGRITMWVTGLERSPLRDESLPDMPPRTGPGLIIVGSEVHPS